MTYKDKEAIAKFISKRCNIPIELARAFVWKYADKIEKIEKITKERPKK